MATCLCGVELDWPLAEAGAASSGSVGSNGLTSPRNLSRICVVQSPKVLKSRSTVIKSPRGGNGGEDSGSGTETDRVSHVHVTDMLVVNANTLATFQRKVFVSASSVHSVYLCEKCVVTASDAPKRPLLTSGLRKLFLNDSVARCLINFGIFGNQSQEGLLFASGANRATLFVGNFTAICKGLTTPSPNAATLTDSSVASAGRSVFRAIFNNNVSTPQANRDSETAENTLQRSVPNSGNAGWTRRRSFLSLDAATAAAHAESLDAIFESDTPVAAAAAAHSNVWSATDGDNSLSGGSTEDIAESQPRTKHDVNNINSNQHAVSTPAGITGENSIDWVLSPNTRMSAVSSNVGTSSRAAAAAVQEESTLFAALCETSPVLKSKINVKQKDVSTNAFNFYTSATGDETYLGKPSLPFTSNLKKEVDTQLNNQGIFAAVVEGAKNVPNKSLSLSIINPSTITDGVRDLSDSVSSTNSSPAMYFPMPGDVQLPPNPDFSSSPDEMTNTVVEETVKNEEDDIPTVNEEAVMWGAIINSMSNTPPPIREALESSFINQPHPLLAVSGILSAIRTEITSSSTSMILSKSKSSLKTKKTSSTKSSSSDKADNIWSSLYQDLVSVTRQLGADRISVLLRCRLMLTLLFVILEAFITSSHFQMSRSSNTSPSSRLVRQWVTHIVQKLVLAFNSRRLLGIDTSVLLGHNGSFALVPEKGFNVDDSKTISDDLLDSELTIMSLLTLLRHLFEPRVVTESGSTGKDSADQRRNSKWEIVSKIIDEYDTSKVRSASLILTPVAVNRVAKYSSIDRTKGTAAMVVGAANLAADLLWSSDGVSDTASDVAIETTATVASEPPATDTPVTASTMVSGTSSTSKSRPLLVTRRPAVRRSSLGTAKQVTVLTTLPLSRSHSSESQPASTTSLGFGADAMLRPLTRSSSGTLTNGTIPSRKRNAQCDSILEDLLSAGRPSPTRQLTPLRSPLSAVNMQSPPSAIDGNSTMPRKLKRIRPENIESPIGMMTPPTMKTTRGLSLPSSNINNQTLLGASGSPPSESAISPLHTSRLSLFNSPPTSPTSKSTDMVTKDTAIAAVSTRSSLRLKKS